MKIYRACCLEEYKKHVKNKFPAIDKRFIFFTHDINFIKNRVQDGNFNNSTFKKNKYDYVVCYDIPDECLKHFTRMGRFELMLDRRNIQHIKWNMEVINANI